MQSPAIPPPHGTSPADAKSAAVARSLVAQMKGWAVNLPDFREPLEDCIEELSWEARLGPAEAVAPAGGAGPDSYSATRIITILKCTAELYPAYARILLCCLWEIEEIEKRRVPAGAKVRARDVVFEAIGQGYGTGPKIADATGLSGWRVRHALRRLHGLGLIRCVGCGALAVEDGNRTRLWELVPSYELKAPRFAA